LKAAKAIAAEQAVERTLIAGQEFPDPPLTPTPDQAMHIEIYATRQTDAEERKQLLDVARRSDQSFFDHYAQSPTRSTDLEPAPKSPVRDIGYAR